MKRLRRVWAVGLVELVGPAQLVALVALSAASGCGDEGETQGPTSGFATDGEMPSPTGAGAGPALPNADPNARPTSPATGPGTSDQPTESPAPGEPAPTPEPDCDGAGAGCIPGNPTPADADRDAAVPDTPDTPIDAGATTPQGSCEPGDAPELHPFGCAFAWGRDDPGGPLAAYAGLDFMSKWVGYEVLETGRLERCDGCTWLSQEVAKTDLTPVYYAYFIGFLGKSKGFPDGNENPDGPNLTTDGAQVIRDHREQLVDMYAYYARESARAMTDRPLLWLLEGDFIQYATGETQKNRLSLTELADLARDITCAIKGNMANAVVAINHTTWNSDEETNDFWDAMANAGVAYDLVWTTGVADNGGFMEQGASAGTYNAATATYAYVSERTGRGLFVDTSFGLSAMSDSWASASADTLNARIADGVIAAHVTGLPDTQVAAVQQLSGSLDPVCDN